MNSVSKSIEPNKKNYQSQYPYKVKGNLTVNFQIHDIKFLLTNKAKTLRYCNMVIMKTWFMATTASTTKVNRHVVH